MSRLTAEPAPTMTRSADDIPMVTSLPPGTTEQDYDKFYCVMSYSAFLNALTK